MGQTLIEKILSNHAGQPLKAGDIADVAIDARVARDFGGANVVKNLGDHGLSIDDPKKTFFTFDCNPGGSDQKYATNQHICRLFARENGIRVFDINAGIGTHIAIDEGLIRPGDTLVSTDSHANIVGAIGAFGQGMGDQDVAAAWANGKIWFKVPESVKIILKNLPPPNSHAKDVVLFLLQKFGASGLLGYAAEFYGDYIDRLDLSSRITVSSMATEMGGIIALFPPNEQVIEYFKNRTEENITPVFADDDAQYDQVVEIELDGMQPLVSRPGHPEDVVAVSQVQGTKIDSAFIGSCTNGRFEDLTVAAEILRNKRVAPGVVLKIVPATQKIWKRCLDEGLIDIFIQAGALVGNAGCAGCAAGQIGQNGPGEVTISTGNRNFAGKQGKGDVYLASPATVVASAVAGIITIPESIPEKPVVFQKIQKDKIGGKAVLSENAQSGENPLQIQGRVWVIDRDNIDTDMIFHNRYLTITSIEEMGPYTFDNLEGWNDFAKKVKPGDIVITGSNFGAGSSRQQAVDCFKSLGIQAIVAKSFGAIYERNAINSGFLIIVSSIVESGIKSGMHISINLKTGAIKNLDTGEKIQSQGFADIQMKIYQKGGIFNLG